MSLNDRFFKLKLKITDIKLAVKKAPANFLKTLKSLKYEHLKSLPSAIFSAIRHTPANLKEWRFKTVPDFARYALLFGLLSFVFYLAGSCYSFTADDAFISFRYVSNAIKGWGYTFNPPPFEPVSGYTSFLWLILLHGLWKIGLEPPHSADLLTFVFSMGQVWMCFLFIRKINIQPKMQEKSLYLFLAVCLILLTNRTFLAFMTSGTEAALFNFLVLWWTFAATSSDAKPYSLSVASVLLALCRPEGIIFALAAVCFLILFMCRGASKLKCLSAFLLSGTIGLYYCWLEKTYGDYLPHSFTAFYRDLFPDIGRNYILSFFLEYAFYFWAVLFIIWAVFKFLVQKQSGLVPLFLLILTFASYIGFYMFVMGGDSLEYRPLSFFIPLCALAGIKMLAENIVGKPATVLVLLWIYGAIAAAIPMTHRAMTKNLETRRETAFLYRSVSGKVKPFGFFTKQWDEVQKNLIYQGIGLRHQEHKILTEELLKTFPSREEGSRIPKAAYQLFAWDFVGVAGWTLPEVIIIDLSGRNNKIVAQTDFKFPDRRLFGHERKIPEGYVQCFGGNSLQINPFIGKKNLIFQKRIPLNEGKIKGCESFWKTQVDKNAPKAKALKLDIR